MKGVAVLAVVGLLAGAHAAADLLVREAHVEGACVGFRVHGDGRDPELPARPEDRKSVV